VAKKNKQGERRVRLRREREKHRHRLERKVLRRERRALDRGQVPARVSKAPKLYAPAIFDIEVAANRSELLAFLRMLREITIKKARPVVIDFSRTEKMVSSGTLLFLAESKRIVALNNARRRIRVRKVLNPKVGEVLHQIGFYDTIGRRSTLSPTAEDVIHWRAIAGRGADGEKADNLVQTVRDRLPATLSSPMYDGLVEAMTNSAQHAYLQPRRDGLRRLGNGEWWMFAREQDGHVYVVFCDLGIGIPNSLPLTHEPGAVRELVARLGRASGVLYTDADLVGAAVEIGRSRIRQSHRGKGLRDIVDVIDKARDGVLRIFSNSGCYTYQVRDGVSSRVYRNYRHSILGTLIQWTVPVRQESG